MRLRGRGLLAVLLVACGVPPAGGPVPVEGTARETLAGTWSGRYRSERGQGHGTIHLVLAPGADTARGRVEMTFSPALALYGEEPAAGQRARRPCTTIDITVVRVDPGGVRGTLAPHWNPACDCRTVSVFSGRLEGGTIAGTFVTRPESGGEALATGRWQAERRR